MASDVEEAHRVIFVLDVVPHEMLLYEELLEDRLVHRIDRLIIEVAELSLGLCHRGWRICACDIACKSQSPIGAAQALDEFTNHKTNKQ